MSGRKPAGGALYSCSGRGSHELHVFRPASFWEVGLYSHRRGARLGTATPFKAGETRESTWRFTCPACGGDYQYRDAVLRKLAPLMIGRLVDLSYADLLLSCLSPPD